MKNSGSNVEHAVLALFLKLMQRKGVYLLYEVKLGWQQMRPAWVMKKWYGLWMKIWKGR